MRFAGRSDLTQPLRGNGRGNSSGGLREPNVDLLHGKYAGAVPESAETPPLSQSGFPSVPAEAHGFRQFADPLLTRESTLDLRLEPGGRFSSVRMEPAMENAQSPVGADKAFRDVLTSLAPTLEQTLGTLRLAGPIDLSGTDVHAPSSCEWRIPIAPRTQRRRFLLSAT